MKDSEFDIWETYETDDYLHYMKFESINFSHLLSYVFLQIYFGD